MRNPFEKALKKLDRPPAAANFVRYLHETPEATGKAIVSWATGTPGFTYQPAQVGCRDRVEIGIDRKAALAICERSGAPAGREANASLVEAFFDYDAIRTYSASNPIFFEKSWFRISREIAVPVFPMSVIRERGKFVPIFLCGWATLPLTRFQRRLLMSLYEDAFLSLTDFLDSPAEVLFFPKLVIEGQKVRQPEVWKRGDYEVLSSSELNEAIDTYLQGRTIARRVIQQRAALWMPPAPGP